MFTRTEYERMSEALQASEEILYAIELVTGEKFELADLDDTTFIHNDAYQLWLNGGWEEEILANLPFDDAVEEGDAVFWGLDVFATFVSGKWVPNRRFKI